MSGRYAEGTAVTPERSMAEVIATLRRYGADGFNTQIDDAKGEHVIVFRVSTKDGRGQRFVRLVLRIPDRAMFIRETLANMRQKPQRRTREQGAADAYEAEVRRRWRALALFVKAALEAVQSEITTLEEVFFAHLLLPDGATVAQHAAASIAHAYQHGTMPAAPLLTIGAVDAEIVRGEP